MVLATFYGDIEKLATRLADEVSTLEAAQKEAELQEQRRKAEQTQNSRLKTQIELLLRENRNHLEATAASLENLKSASKINTAGIKSLEEMLPVLDAEAGKKADLLAKGEDNKGAEIASGAGKVAIFSLAGCNRPFRLRILKDFCPYLSRERYSSDLGNRTRWSAIQGNSS